MPRDNSRERVDCTTTKVEAGAKKLAQDATGAVDVLRIPALAKAWEIGITPPHLTGREAVQLAPFFLQPLVPVPRVVKLALVVVVDWWIVDRLIMIRYQGWVLYPRGAA
jgi:hypothetical protein